MLSGEQIAPAEAVSIGAYEAAMARALGDAP